MMKISVEMDAAEFEEFMAWRRDRKVNEREANKARGELEHFADKVLWAIGPDPEKTDRYGILDQDHAGELLEMAEEVLM